MNASVFRNTAWELRTYEQGANDFVVLCSSRMAAPDVVVEGGRPIVRAKRGPVLSLHESLFTEEEMKTLHAGQEILERVYGKAYDEWAASPERNAELLIQAVDAKKALDATQAEHQAAAKALEQRRQELAVLDEQLAAKRMALEAMPVEDVPVATEVAVPAQSTGGGDG